MEIEIQISNFFAALIMIITREITFPGQNKPVLRLDRKSGNPSERLPPQTQKAYTVEWLKKAILMSNLSGLEF